jgi:hypothetical protein
MSDLGQITIYLVGDDEQDARTYYPYDTYEAAAAFCDSTGVAHVYKASAYIDWDSLEKP